MGRSSGKPLQASPRRAEAGTYAPIPGGGAGSRKPPLTCAFPKDHRIEAVVEHAVRAAVRPSVSASTNHLDHEAIDRDRRSTARRHIYELDGVQAALREGDRCQDLCADSAWRVEVDDTLVDVVGVEPRLTAGRTLDTDDRDTRTVRRVGH